MKGDIGRFKTSKSKKQGVIDKKYMTPFLTKISLFIDKGMVSCSLSCASFLLSDVLSHPYIHHLHFEVFPLVGICVKSIFQQVLYIGRTQSGSMTENFHASFENRVFLLCNGTAIPLL